MQESSPAIVLLKTATLALLLSAAAWADEIYVWTDEDGVKHYSSVPPPADTGAELIELEEAPRPGSEYSQALPEQDSGGVEISGNMPLDAPGQSDTAVTDERTLAQLCEATLTRLEELEAAPASYEIQPDGTRVPVADDERSQEYNMLKRYVDRICQ